MAETVVTTNAPGAVRRSVHIFALSLSLCALQPASAAAPACFTQPRDGSGVGDLHLLSADPLDVSRLAELNVRRARPWKCCEAL